MKKLYFSIDDKNRIFDLYYNKNNTITDIADIFHCSYTAMQNEFKANGWQPRDRNQGNRQYHFNEHVFDTIDTPEKAFCFGLLLADGCNHLNSNEVSICLQERDKEVLEMLNSVFGSDYPLHFHKAYNTQSQNTYSLRISSNYFSQKCTEIGFTPRKSLTLDFPKSVPDKYIGNMLNGYIAGDGWVQKYVIGFMSTDKFCYGTKDFLSNLGIESHVYDPKRHYNEHTKILQISHRNNIIPFVELMCDNCSIFLRRKYEKLIEYGFVDLDKSISV